MRGMTGLEASGPTGCPGMRNVSCIAGCTEDRKQGFCEKIICKVYEKYWALPCKMLYKTTNKSGVRVKSQGFFAKNNFIVHFLKNGEIFRE